MKHPLIRIIIVFVTGMIVARIFWFLGFIPNLFRNIIDPGNCSGHQVKTIGMYICSAFVAFKMLIGPLLIMALIYIFRKSIINFIQKNKHQIPADYQFMLAPLVSTLIFTILWSGSHPSITDVDGLMNQRYFPAIVGVFTFVTTEFHTQIQQSLTGFFEKRDRIAKPIRFLIAFAIPFLLSIIITFEDRVSNVAVKEQIIVLISLVSGYLVLLPAKGKIQLKKINR